MNDPWSNLIDTLAGNEPKTPTWWPQSNVHRILDDSLTSAPRPRQRALRPPEAPTRREAATPRFAPLMRARCPCTNCKLERAKLLPTR